IDSLPIARHLPHHRQTLQSRGPRRRRRRQPPRHKQSGAHPSQALSRWVGCRIYPHLALALVVACLLAVHFAEDLLLPLLLSVAITLPTNCHPERSRRVLCKRRVKESAVALVFALAQNPAVVFPVASTSASSILQPTLL